MSPSQRTGVSPSIPAGLQPQALAVDRDAEVPIGIQLAWAIRTRIDEGTLGVGERLPGLRDLAQALGINANTVRAVYARLEHEGLLDSRQGSGTFVATGDGGRPRASSIAARAAREAIAAGVDPRKVATALYVQSASPDAEREQADRRGALRAQIAALEQALGELEAEHPTIARRARQEHSPTRAAGISARLPSAAELEQVKSSLLRRLSAIQASVDALQRPDPAAAGAEKPKRAKSAPAASRKVGGRGAKPSRPAPAGA